VESSKRVGLHDTGIHPQCRWNMDMETYDGERQCPDPRMRNTTLSCQCRSNLLKNWNGLGLDLVHWDT